MIINRYYPGEPVNIYIQSLINIIQEKNWVIITKKDEDKLPLFCGNGEQVNPIYADLTWIREVVAPLLLQIPYDKTGGTQNLIGIIWPVTAYTTQYGA